MVHTGFEWAGCAFRNRAAAGISWTSHPLTGKHLPTLCPFIPPQVSNHTHCGNICPMLRGRVEMLLTRQSRPNLSSAQLNKDPWMGWRTGRGQVNTRLAGRITSFKKSAAFSTHQTHWKSREKQVLTTQWGEHERVLPCLRKDTLWSTVPPATAKTCYRRQASQRQQ